MARQTIKDYFMFRGLGIVFIEGLYRHFFLSRCPLRYFNVFIYYFLLFIYFYLFSILFIYLFIYSTLLFIYSFILPSVLSNTINFKQIFEPLMRRWQVQPR